MIYAIAEATVQRRRGELYFFVSSFLDRVLMTSSFLVWRCSTWCLRASLVLRPAGLSLVHQKFLLSLVYLQLVDMFHGDLLVYEHVILHLQVQAVIYVVVNLLGFMVSAEQLAQNYHPPHPG